MAFQTWQVGLDIQNGQLCAIGIQRRRNGWQLRHWWHYKLPHDTLRNGLVQRPDIVIDVLRRWQRLLPSRISLRIGFPPQLVMQRQLALPALPLQGAAYTQYIQAAAKRVFPVDPATLALDYRQQEEGSRALTLSATRKEALQSWLNCLQHIGRLPDVVELTPSALMVLAQALSLAADTVLVHRLADHWLWYAPTHDAQPWGWCPVAESADFVALQQRCLPEHSTIWYSSTLSEPLPAGTKQLMPLAALQYLQPPLPADAGAYALALGLALRPGDY